VVHEEAIRALGLEEALGRARIVAIPIGMVRVRGTLEGAGQLAGGEVVVEAEGTGGVFEAHGRGDNAQGRGFRPGA
jgi:hypothetical protein